MHGRARAWGPLATRTSMEGASAASGSVTHSSPRNATQLRREASIASPPPPPSRRAADEAACRCVYSKADATTERGSSASLSWRPPRPCTARPCRAAREGRGGRAGEWEDGGGVEVWRGLATCTLLSWWPPRPCGARPCGLAGECKGGTVG
eukprot:364732-Chlamydomonas_euryale.AAC.2